MTDPRSSLDAARAETIARIAALRGDVHDIIDSASSTTGDDEHDPEGATIGFERAQAQGLLAQAERRLTSIDAASQLLAEGRYGACTNCGRPIAAERLEARPEVTVCIECARLRS